MSGERQVPGGLTLEVQGARLEWRGWQEVVEHRGLDGAERGGTS